MLTARHLPMMLCLIAACDAVSDPLDTGLKIQPSPGDWEGPVDLTVINRAKQDITCVLYEDDYCPSLVETVPFPETLQPGDTWRVLDVTCASVDFACWAADSDRTTMPLRSWGWFVQPALEDE